MSEPQSQSSTNFGTPLIQFQLDSIPISKKSEASFGKQIAEYIMSTINGGTSNYFFVRNERWRTNRNIANGKINMQRFMDMLEFNGKQNYVNLNWQCIKLGNRIISGLVSRWMERLEKISVTAVDSLSVAQKEKEYAELEFYLDQQERLQKIQQASGVPILPDDLPADKEQLLLWKSELQRLPEEILFETGCNDVLSANGWFDVIKEKVLWDAACTGFLGSYTWMDSEGVIHVDHEKPENCFYSYSDYPDFRDTSWRGVMKTRKISEVRKKYGREFNPTNPLALSEETLFEMAKTAKEYRLYDNITWLTEYNMTFLRPYDEWNIDLLEFELRTVDSEAYTVVKTKGNGSTLIKKGKPKKVKDNESVIEDSRINIYRGVYARTNMIMLEWGLKDNMIRPQDPKELGNAEFSYSFNMVQNYDMTCLGIPEKIQEPLEQMIIARLKIQQVVAKMRPPGAAINWRAVQNIDYGLGEANKSIDFKKMFDQTGEFYYHDKDAEGNPIGVPFTEIPNSGFLPQLQGLILLYDKHYQILKDELGEDPNIISQALQPRVTEGNVETSQQQADYSTDQYYRGYVNLIEDASRKVSCLLNDSVTYGAEVYRRVVNQEAVKDRIFTTKIQLLPNAVELQRFEGMMNQAVASNPDLITFLDPFQLMRIARRDVKLGETFFRQAQKKMLIWQRQTAQQNQQQTIDGQIKSAQAAEQAKGENLEMELNVKAAIAEHEAKVQQENIATTGLWAYINSRYAPQKGSGENATVTIPPIPSDIQKLIDITVANNINQFIQAQQKQQQESQQQQEQIQEQPQQQVAA